MSSEEQLLQSFERLRKALFDRDTEIIREMIAEEYHGFDPRGRVQDRQAILEAYCRGGVELDRYDVEDLQVRIIGKAGIITGTGRIHGKYAESEFAHYLRFLDLYIRSGGLWRLYLSQVTPLEAV